MQNVIDPKKTSGVSLAANASYGDNWVETEEIK
jgi:hypothetical protein